LLADVSPGAYRDFTVADLRAFIKCRASEHRRRFLLITFVCFISACSSYGIRQPDPPPVSEPVAQEGYALQPGDVIRVTVWREPELDQVVLVRPDGGISFPLVGEVYVEGRTIEEVGFEISERLALYIPDPAVSVSLQQSEGNRVYVTGRVANPGVFLANRPITIMQAISLAGGLTPFADKDGIIVLRQDGEQQRSIPFNYNDVQKGKSLAQNIVLQPGDTLVVP
jgi:polysaccharide export outer membrane protein